MKKVLFTIEVDGNVKADVIAKCPDYEIDFVEKKDVSSVDGYDIVVGNVNPELIKGIEWIQLESAGCDPWLKIDENIMLTNATGAYGKAISEHMLAVVLHFLKKINLYIPQQKEHVWINQGRVKSISDLKVLVVGLGNIGKNFAKIMKSFGCTVYGVKRRVNENVEYVDGIYSFENMDEVIGECDVVALSLPNTDATYHIMNEERLRKMQKDAIIVNVGRGPAIDTEALLKVLADGYFTGVALDVFEGEPLDPNSPLWDAPRVLVTPHVSGNYNMQYTYDKVIEIVTNNLNSYAKGEALHNQIDRVSGYTK